MSARDRRFKPLAQCWSIVCEAGPTFNQHWFNAFCFMGSVGLHFYLFSVFRDGLASTMAFTRWRCSAVSGMVMGRWGAPRAEDTCE